MTLQTNLRQLAERYETADFLKDDPSQFMHQVEGADNQELLAFVASTLSYGSRKQFLPKIAWLLEQSRTEGLTFREWIVSGAYSRTVPADSKRCFYRLYTFGTMHSLLSGLQSLLVEHGTLKSFMKSNAPTHPMTCLEAVSIIVNYFSSRGIEGIVPKNTHSSCKRVCMFLRWMVRDESPVDLGLWADIIDKSTLIIPMDTHVVSEACRLGLLQSRTTSMSAALKLSRKLREIFPNDPTKGDFALFGLGVDENK